MTIILVFFLALIAGIGYGAFLTISPRFNIGSGLLVVNSLMLFGMLYLFIPFAHEGLVFITDTHTVILLTLLALFQLLVDFCALPKRLRYLKVKQYN